MGQVIRFPFERRLSSNRTEPQLPDGSATIIILPVVRIERHGAPGKAPRLRAKSATVPVGTGRKGS